MGVDEFLSTQHSMIVDGGLVSVDVCAFLCDQGRCAWLARVKVPEPLRGRGHGSRALDKMLEAADEHGVVVILTPNAYGALNEEQLIAWYERRGFKEVKPGLWRRDPNETPGPSPTTKERPCNA